MKRFVSWALLAASLSANLAVAAVALRWRSSAPSNEPLLFSKVALEPEQRARIAELRAQLVAKRDAHARRLAELRTRLAAAMTDEVEDPAAIESTLGSIAEAQAGFQRAVVEHVLTVRALLRTDQRRAFEEVVAGQLRAGGPMHCGFGAPAGEEPDR